MADPNDPPGFQAPTRSSRARRTVPAPGTEASSTAAGGSVRRRRAVPPEPDVPTPSTPAHQSTSLTVPPASAATSSAASSGKKKKSKDLTLMEKYPDAYKDATRENIKTIINNGSLNYIAFEYKNYGFVTPDEYNAMKEVCEFEFRKHFIALGTNKTAFAVIKSVLPNVNLDSTTARDLRQYLIDRFAEWKFELTNNTYAYTLSMIKQYGSQLDIDLSTQDGRAQLARFFKPRIDANLFRNLYGQAHSKVIQVDLMFADKNKTRLCVWFINQHLQNIFLKQFPLVKSEIELNRTTGPGGTPLEWSAKLSRDSTFVKDTHLRRQVTDLIDMMPTNSNYSGVELNQFPWYKFGDEMKKRAAQDAEGAAPKRLASEIANEQMFFSTPPPAAGTPFGSGATGSGDTGQSHRFRNIDPILTRGIPSLQLPVRSRSGSLVQSLSQPPSQRGSRAGTPSQLGSRSGTPLGSYMYPPPPPTRPTGELITMPSTSQQGGSQTQGGTPTTQTRQTRGQTQEGQGDIPGSQTRQTRSRQTPTQTQEGRTQGSATRRGRGRGGGGTGGATFGLDGACDFYDDEMSSLTEYDTEEEDNETMRGQSESPTVQLMERGSRYRGFYH